MPNVDTLAMSFAQAGKSYMLSTGRVVSPNGLGNWRGVIKNPATHTRNLAIYRLDIMVNLDLTYIALSLNPTLNAPILNPRVAYNVNLESAITRPVTLNFDFDTTNILPLAGGFPTEIVFPVIKGAQSSTELPPLIVPPGVTLGFNVPYKNVNEGALNVYWWEMDRP